MTHRAPVAWMVVSHDGGHRALFLERARAERWAPDCHGTVHPLYLWPDPVPADAPVLVQPEWDKNDGGERTLTRQPNGPDGPPKGPT